MFGRIVVHLCVALVVIALGVVRPPRLGAQEKEGPAQGGVGAAAAEKPDQPPPVRLTEGVVPVIVYLKFLQRATGKPVVYPSADHDPAFSESITIVVLADVEPVTPDFIVRLLAVNGYNVTEEVLADGSRVLNVSHVDAKRTALPRPTKVVDEQEFDALTQKKTEEAKPKDEGGASQTTIAVRDLLVVMRGSPANPDIWIVAPKAVRDAQFMLRGDWRGAPREVLLAALEAAGFSGVPLRRGDGKQGLLFRSKPAPLVFGENEVILIQKLANLSGADAQAKLSALLAEPGAPEVNTFSIQLGGADTLVIGATEKTIDIIESKLQQLDAAAAPAEKSKK